MRVPGAVRVAQVILWIEAIFEILIGLLFVLAGGAMSVSSGAKGILVAAGVVAIIIGALLIWPTVLLGRLSRGARTAITILVGIGIVFQLLSLARGGVASIIGLILGVVVLYCLWGNADARTAFDTVGSSDSSLTGASSG